MQNGAILGAAYARFKPSLPGLAVLRGLLAGLIEHVATWPMTVLVDRYHPACNELPKLAANHRAFGQATIRHAVFGIVDDAFNRSAYSRCSSVSSSLSGACRAGYSRIHR